MPDILFFIGCALGHTQYTPLSTLPFTFLRLSLFRHVIAPWFHLSQRRVQPAAKNASAILSVERVACPNYLSLSGSVVVFEEPSGADCIPGGVCPCGLEAGAPPWPVLVGPVQPCGCF